MSSSLEGQNSEGSALDDKVIPIRYYEDDILLNQNARSELNTSIKSLKQPISNLQDSITTADSNFLSNKPKPKEMIGDYFFKGCTAVIAAAGGVGKTTWAIHESLSLLCKDPALEIMFISSEDSTEDYQAKLYNAIKHKSIAIEDVVDRIHIMDLRGMGIKLISEDGGCYVPSSSAHQLSESIKKKSVNINLIFFETASRFSNGETNEHYEALVSACDHIAIENSAAVVIVTHVGKSQAREKVKDIYAGRGGSVLGDNSRGFIVCIQCDLNYLKSTPIDVDEESIINGNVFEVSHVRSSYSKTEANRYFVVREGSASAPVLDEVYALSVEDVRKARLEDIHKKENKAIKEIIEYIKSNSKVPRKYFDDETMSKIGVTQTKSRDLIKQLIDNQLLIEFSVPHGKTSKKYLKVNEKSNP